MSQSKDHEKNGEVKGDRDKEVYTDLGGGALLEESSGNIVEPKDVVKDDPNEKGNGKQGDK